MTEGAKTHSQAKTPLAALTAAAALVSEGWTPEHFAARADGTPTGALSDDARRFSALGALDRVASDEGCHAAAVAALHEATLANPGPITQARARDLLLIAAAAVQAEGVRQERELYQ